ncbi:hypothetical protein A2524_03655 [Candidatus Wolfebacteria bacterium RIFOXYD12_FULL_48_21]|uniref:Uncharacterized protein n=1 Tax=Candidatus Wolfebacteria bacterium RIFOXYD1_FULL_48_65 TaxID=1802561 RepID=A0A1F8DYL8_9BACT|nr:MAG: hypothetical protein A2610_00195 [Candidatus Wolfebacteria bacterium RIFOXYD1_FULL_48_65]OGM95148.1 MAG: hypothetical protein A2524_03655 [Candidatus Wolfebacteria bacterium RIFOXYD12_FULL_48_21]OGM95759.1 MAG: hypothetical protein A2532_03540 [Candidatus Wolfebacteria bacterium RIFOXYD2_FULL_48_11]
MREKLGKYIQRLSAFGIIVIGAKVTSDGFAALKSTAAMGRPVGVSSIVLGALWVLIGCLFMAASYTLEQQRGNRKKGGRK